MLLLAILKRSGKVHFSLLPVCHLEHEILLSKHCLRKKKKKKFLGVVCRFRVSLSLASCKVEFSFFFQYSYRILTCGKVIQTPAYDTPCVPSDFWICFFIWGNRVSYVAGAVMSNILLFIWHSAYHLLLTKSVTPQEPPVWGLPYQCREVVIILTVGNTAISGIPGWKQCNSDTGSLPFTF